VLRVHNVEVRLIDLVLKDGETVLALLLNTNPRFLTFPICLRVRALRLGHMTLNVLRPSLDTGQTYRCGFLQVVAIARICRKNAVLYSYWEYSFSAE